MEKQICCHILNDTAALVVLVEKHTELLKTCTERGTYGNVQQRTAPKREELMADGRISSLI